MMDVCPRCGAGLGPNDVRHHFERTHPGLLGVAIRDEMDAFEFAFVAPVHGTGGREWHVIAFGWPFGLVKIRPSEWAIRWQGGRYPESAL